MLVTNSLKNDLGSASPFVCALALCALGAVASPEMSRDLAADVERLLGSENAYVRKKAALCGVRVVRKVPELAEGFLAAAPHLLRDRHHGVLLGGAVFCSELLRAAPAAAATALRPCLADALKALSSLASASSGGEHDVGGVTDPFLQVALLRLLRRLGAGDAAAADAMADALARVITSTDVSKNAGAAVQYEAVQTALGVASAPSLRALAINALGRFLATPDNNRRYSALSQLAAVAAGPDGGAVQRHRSTIVACLRDADVSIRRRALDLVVSLVTDANAAALVPELIAYLTSGADADARASVAAKIASLAARHAPSKRWHLDTLMAALRGAGGGAEGEQGDAVRGGCVFFCFFFSNASLITSFQVRGGCVLVANAPELQPYAARAAFRALATPELRAAAPAGLAAFAVWMLGEFGEALFFDDGSDGSSPPLSAAPTGPQLEDGEPPFAPSTLPGLAVEVPSLLDAILRDSTKPESLKGLATVAAAKLASRCASVPIVGGALASKLLSCVRTHASSTSLELQQRSIECSALVAGSAEAGGGPAPAGALDAMPPPDEGAWAARHGAGAHAPLLSAAPLAECGADGAPNSPGRAAPRHTPPPPPPPAAAVPAALTDLLGSFDAMSVAASHPPSPSLQPPPLAPAPAPAAAPSSSAAAALADLLGGASGAPAEVSAPAAAPAAPAAPPPPPPSQHAQPSPLSQPPPQPLSQPLSASPPSLGGSLGPPVLAFSRGGVTVSFEASKPVGGPAHTTQLTALFANASDAPATDFVLHAAVPKFMTLSMQPASEGVLRPHAAPASQAMTVVNSLHGSKPLVLRLKIAYTQAGERVEEVVTFAGLPAGA